MMKKISLLTGAILTSLLLMACGGESETASSATSDSLLQPVEDNGMPLDNLERSREDADSVDHHIDDSSGVPLDNLHRDKDDDVLGEDVF